MVTFINYIRKLICGVTAPSLRGRAGGEALILFLLVTLSSCVTEEQYDNTPTGNFEALWKVMDEHYCFFDYKKEQLGVDWTNVYARYSQQVSDKMSNAQLFEFLGNMIGELKDGHVNLSASFDYSRSWSWKENYPTNFSDTLQRKYLGTDYHISNGLYYRILDDNIGYIYCGTFEKDFGAGNLDEILLALAPCNGLILDIRNNGGGQLTSAETLAARFTNKDVLVGYMQHKTGTGHNDFSNKEEQWIRPSSGIRWQKPLCLLTNRSVYSAANEFTKYIKEIFKSNSSNSISGSLSTGDGKVSGLIVGDHTGGGAGMPFSSELPNGWAVRFSACPMYDSQGNSTEQGIDPDVFVNLTDDDFAKGKDTIIEYARKIINQ